MKVLVLSFYYPPDLAAGSFRTKALIDQFESDADVQVDVITTMPNRYHSFRQNTPRSESWGNVSIRRIPLPSHSSGLFDQMLAYAVFMGRVLPSLVGKRYDVVFATSSRLMTAFLGALAARIVRAPLYLDIRDLFVDTVGDIFAGARASVAIPVFTAIERFTFRSARVINVVSPGFTDHVSSIATGTAISEHTNGIDREFLGVDFVGLRQANESVVVLYAGNVGAGQALEKVIPDAARALAGTHVFRVIGDGGRRGALEHACMGLENVEILDPVSRGGLIDAYRNADVLLIHLNRVPAFLKVLPSKVFEYGATGKPIVAGVAGFAREFVESEVDRAETFDPLSVDGLVGALQRVSTGVVPRERFCERYGRDGIMERVKQDLMQVARQ